MSRLLSSDEETWSPKKPVLAESGLDEEPDTKKFMKARMRSSSGQKTAYTVADFQDLGTDIPEARQGLIGLGRALKPTEKNQGLDKFRMDPKFADAMYQARDRCRDLAGNHPGCDVDRRAQELMEFLKSDSNYTKPGKEWDPLQFSVLVELANRLKKRKGGHYGLDLNYNPYPEPDDMDVDDEVDSDDDNATPSGSSGVRRTTGAFSEKTSRFGLEGVHETKADEHPLDIYRVPKAKSAAEKRRRRYINHDKSLNLENFKHVVKDLIIDKMNLQYPGAGTLLSKHNCDADATIDEIVMSRGQAFLMPFTDPNVMQTPGVLIWANTGFGKTCAALVMTALWELETDYKVVFVTQKVLRYDLLKNVYDQVCFIPFLRKAAKDPAFAAKFDRVKGASKQEQLDFLSNQTNGKFRVLTYEQARNLMSGKVRQYKDWKYGTKEDPLAKTFFVFDEVHITNGDEAKGKERIDPQEIFDGLYRSIEKSGKDAAKFAFLSATPWNGNDAHIVKAFQLIYLCRGLRPPAIYRDADRFNEMYVQAKLDRKNGNGADFKRFIEKVVKDFRQISEPVLVYLDLSTDAGRFPIFQSFQTVMYTLPPRQVQDMTDEVGKDIDPRKGPTMEQARILLARSLTINLEKAGPPKNPSDVKAIRENIDLISPAAKVLFDKIDEIDTENIAKFGHVGKHLIVLPVEGGGKFGGKTLEEFFDICVAYGGLEPIYVDAEIRGKKTLVFNERRKIDYSWRNSASKWRRAGFMTKGKYHGLTMDHIEFGSARELARMKDGVAATKALWNFRAGDDDPKNPQPADYLGKKDQPQDGNNFGQQCRFLFVGWEFRLGWDSKDTVAVHYFGEPDAGDLLQLLGRSQRTCSNAGVEFKKGHWGIDVVNYKGIMPAALVKPARFLQKGGRAKHRGSVARRVARQQIAERFGIGLDSAGDNDDEDEDEDEEDEEDQVQSDDDEPRRPFAAPRPSARGDTFSSKVRKMRSTMQGRLKGLHKLGNEEDVNEVIRNGILTSPSVFQSVKRSIRRGLLRYGASVFKKRKFQPRQGSSSLSTFLDKDFDAEGVGSTSFSGDADLDEKFGFGGNKGSRSKLADTSFLIPKKLEPALWTRGEQLLHATISKFRGVDPVNDFGLDPSRVKPDSESGRDKIAQDTIFILGPILKLVAMTSFLNHLLAGNINNPYAPPVTGVDLTAQNPQESWKRYEYIDKIKEAVAQLKDTRPASLRTKNKKLEAFWLPDDAVAKMAAALEEADISDREGKYFAGELFGKNKNKNKKTKGSGGWGWNGKSKQRGAAFNEEEESDSYDSDE